MNSRLQAVFAALGFFLPLVAFRNWQVWDRSPAPLGMHFDLAGRPNIWIAREPGLTWVLLLMAVILAAATLVRSHLADEVHASPWLAWGTLVPAAAELVIAARVPAAARILLILSAFVLTGVAATAWSGFRYFFFPLGVIRILSFHLYPVPAGQIKDYAVARWNPLGGYGIGGLEKRRAFVWGNQGVGIHTTEGEIFLGHRDPERMIHDLDAIKQLAH